MHNHSKRSPFSIVFITLIWAAGFASGPERAVAGDRELSILFVNMTPGEDSSQASKACVSTIRKELKAGYTSVTAKGESWIRAQHQDGKVEDFMRWSRVKKDVREKLGFVDAFMLVDCRPEKSSVRVWVCPANDRLGRVELTRKPSRADLKFLTKMLLSHGWIGFVP